MLLLLTLLILTDHTIEKELPQQSDIVLPSTGESEKEKREASEGGYENTLLITTDIMDGPTEKNTKDLKKEAIRDICRPGKSERSHTFEENA